MEFPTSSPPHLPVQHQVARMMQLLLLALLPGILCAWWVLGWGVLINLLLAGATAVLAEALMLRLRGRAVLPTLGDYSALVTGLLLALALPPLAPWWIPVIGTLFAIVLAKHLYGGLGYNPFNPAMIGYVVLLISFPREMSLWVAPTSLGATTLDLLESLRLVFAGVLPPAVGIDAITMATPLDSMKIRLGLDETLSEITSSPLFGRYGGTGWEWINFWFLVGGLVLLYFKVIRWQIPVAMLGSLFLVSGLFYLGDSDQYASPLFHLFSGAAMLGAFFIATDPVSAATTTRGRLYFGAGIGLLVYIIRTWGGYPDGVAFAVLLMNMAAPTIDYYTRPRSFGHKG
jgi:electron transport complex protein RnfD